jgi:nucleoside-diphosphate-sugar epimerase
VVQQLLDQGLPVRVIVRSRERMLEALTDNSNHGKLLTVTEASLLDLSDDELQAAVDDVDAVVSCLGHNLNFRGMFGQPRRLCTEAAERLTAAMMKSKINKDASAAKPKFILMNSEGVAHPDGTDDERSFGERTILFLLRYLIPPHSDNEQAAAHVHSLGKDSGIEWCVVRPTDLIDGDVTEYRLLPKPRGSLFGGGEPATRANVAKCMVDMITDDSVWNQWKFQLPVVMDDAAKSAAGAEEEKK